MRENAYQRRLIGTLKDLFPDCIVLKNDASYMQGIPDIIILWGSCWAMLEIKRETKAATQVNQEYWVDVLNEMSFASFISPETEAEVLNELQHAFGLVR